jgi:Electron transfer flavoprotein-ubiquinone oxidoreductase, 4Fe-4S
MDLLELLGFVKCDLRCSRFQFECGVPVSLGFVTGLDYPDPRLDPQHLLQEFKKHPFVAKLLQGGHMIRYGAKSLPYGGWWSIPPVSGDGWMILGDSAGFLNSQRLKGIHLAIKSGMLAAETEMVEASDVPSGKQIHLNPSNCVHCKTCDIMDPYEIITWVPPEGGGGPNYDGM